MATRKPNSIGSISIEEFIAAVSRLKPDQPYHRRGGIWYGTTQDQWLGWLSQYNSAGFYSRQGRGYDARFAYNHVQNHQMLVWLIAAAGVDAPTVARAAAAGEAGKSMAAKAAAVRKIVPWEHVAALLRTEVRGQQ